MLEKIPFVGPMLYLMGRQILFFSPDQHNNFDHFSAGFTSFHRKEEIRGWYDGLGRCRGAVRRRGEREHLRAGHAAVNERHAAAGAFCGADALPRRDRVGVAGCRSG